MNRCSVSYGVSKQAAVAVLTLCLLSTGCASKYGPQLTTANYYPQCYRPVAELREDENQVGKSAATGAVGGALLGALIGGLATGKAEGALVGAAAGAAGGAIAGGVYGSHKQNQRDQQKVAAYMRQLDGEAAGMNRATAAAKVSAKCYDQQFKLAAADFKSGRLTRQEFTDRYTEIRSGMEETSRILGRTATAMADKDRQYQQVLTDEERQYAYAQSTPAPAPSRAKGKTQVRRASAPAQAPSPVAAKTAQWNNSRQELDSTKQDVDERMRGYSQTVDELLG